MNAPVVIVRPEIQIFTRGLATLILGDARDLSYSYSGEADLVFSDPPYKLTAGGRPKKDGKHKIMSGIFCPNIYDNSGKLMEIPSWDEISQVITEISHQDAEAYVMANDKNYAKAENAMVDQKWKLHNILVWDKLCPLPNRFYMKHLEFIAYMWRGKARPINDPSCRQLVSEKAPRGRDKIHPTQKPVEIIRKYISNSTREGHTVMDPYAGSAATLVAAALEGRRAIGFEKSPAHFAAAVRRMETEIP